MSGVWSGVHTLGRTRLNIGRSPTHTEVLLSRRSGWGFPIQTTPDFPVQCAMVVRLEATALGAKRLSTVARSTVLRLDVVAGVTQRVVVMHVGFDRVPSSCLNRDLLLPAIELDRPSTKVDVSEGATSVAKS